MIYSGDLIKVNGDFSSTEKAREYAINPIWQNYDALWSFVSAAQEDIGSTIYEHIANLVQNVRDIDECGLHQLYSMAKELDVDQIFSYDLAYPPELEEIMNTLSINRSFTTTSGYVLLDQTLQNIYSSIGTNVSGTVYLSGDSISTNAYYDTTGMVSSTIITDEDYISGLVEPVIKSHLIENSIFLGSGNYNNPTQEVQAYNNSLIYQGFLDDIYYDPNSIWSESTSSEIVEYCTHILRNICIRASYQRETLKTIAQKHAMIGSTHSIEKILEEYILRSFTKKDNWRLYVEPSGSLKPSRINDAYQMEQMLPQIESIANPNFDVRVVEYWDNTEYMNISAESPLVCGITGYSITSGTTSVIDISGNLITGIVTGWTPDYGTGLCGYVITGGNNRFWEDESLSDAILLSETNSGEISAFYHNIGLTGSLSDMWGFQQYLWNMHATSGLDRMAVISELTGIPTDDYTNTPTSAIPDSGWLVQPTSLSDMHYKYIGTISGDTPQANIKNQQYPTIAPQPFIWNLVEKVYEDFPRIYQTLLFTDQTASEHLSAQVDISGNLIDSWLFYNQEYIGYNTQYEQSVNLDFNDQFNPSIDRDGPFDTDALSAYLDYISSGYTPISEYMSGYYSHIEKNFNITLSESPSICAQLDYYQGDIISLSSKHIYQYAYDQLDNHYMLYKDDDEFETKGQLWMRYRNHPIAFPMSEGDETKKRLQQLYMWGGAFQPGNSLEPIVNSNCYDFGFVGDIMWIFGEDQMGNGRILVFANDYQYFTAEQQYHYSYVNSSFAISDPAIPKENFIGVYSYLDYIVFVYLDNLNGNTGVGTFKFKHYDKYRKQFVDSPLETRIISGLQPQYTGTTDHIWKLSDSEEIVTLAYESINSDTASEFVNSITTIDFLKNTLSDAPGEYSVFEWKYVLENM